MAAVTLSQICAWSTEHLTNAASYWTQTADHWEDTFLTMRNQSQSIAWHGVSGDALRQRTGTDLTLVTGKADQLRQAAGIARNGASDISTAKQRVLFAVEDAQNAGFDVGENLSVSYHDHGGTAAEQAARQAQAEQLATEIWSRAAQLEGADAKVAGQLTGAVNGFGSGAPSAPAHGGSGVQLVDFKQDGGNQPNPPPHIPTTEENEKGLLARVAEGAIIGGISGLPEGGVGAVPGMIIGGGLGGIEWFIESTQK